MTGEEKRRTYHIRPCGAYYTVCFCVNRAAKLVTLTFRNIKLFTGAYSEVGTVFKTSRRTVVSRGDYLIVVYYYCTEIPAQAGAALAYRFGYVKVVIYFIASFHSYDHSFPLRSKAPKANETKLPLTQRHKICYNMLEEAGTLQST